MNICFVGFGNIAQAIIEGLLKSGISSENIACIERNQEKSFINKYNKKTLLNRMATEEDISEPVLFLASDMSSYITGQNIIVAVSYTHLTLPTILLV